MYMKTYSCIESIIDVRLYGRDGLYYSIVVYASEEHYHPSEDQQYPLILQC